MRRGALWSLTVHAGFILLISITAVLYPSTPRPRIGWRWEPVSIDRIAGLRIPADGPRDTLQPRPVDLSAARQSISLRETELAAERRKRLPPIIHRGEDFPSPVAESLPRHPFTPPTLPRELRDPPSEPGTLSVRLPLAAIPVPNPIELGLPPGVVPRWRQEIPDSGTLSAASLGITGPPELMERPILSAPVLPSGVVVPEGLYYRFAVTPSGRVTEVQPEILWDLEFSQIVHATLLRWRFAPLKEGEERVMRGRIEIR